MLQAAEKVLHAVRATGSSLPRLLETDERVAVDAAEELSLKAAAQIGDDEPAHRLGGMLFLHHMLSNMVALYGKSAIIATAAALDKEQRRIRDEYFDEALKGLDNE